MERNEARGAKGLIAEIDRIQKLAWLFGERWTDEQWAQLRERHGLPT